jgi:hypothetical protein
LGLEAHYEGGGGGRKNVEVPTHPKGGQTGEGELYKTHTHTHTHVLNRSNIHSMKV